MTMMHLVLLRLGCFFIAVTCTLTRAQVDGESSSVVSPLSKRWIRIDVNGFVQSTIDQAIAVIRRGAAVGYNGVVIQDTKMSFYSETFSQSNKQVWIDRLRQVIDVARYENNMHVSLGVLPFGYSEGFLRHDVNLASGHPIRDSPMVVTPRGSLAPIQTANLLNGGFERVSGSSFVGYDYIDGLLGDTLVQDLKNFKEGAASLRFSIPANGGQSHARFFQTVRVRPFSHYRFTLVFKADSISCDWSAFLVIDPSSDETRFIGHLQEIQSDGTYRERQGLNDYTTDWVKQGIAFNSLDLNEVTIVFGLWGPSSGTLWLDDVKIESVPTLNLLRRDDLPISLVSSPSDEPYIEGADFEPLSDPLLGNDGPYSGLYGILHDPPTIQATPTGRLAVGQQVLFSGHHALPVFSNFQMTASLTTPRIFEIVHDILENVYIDLAPDSFFFEHDEIRTGGWEEQQVGLYSNAGNVLAENLRQCHALASLYNLPILIWNDMVDPFHNAGGAPFYSARVSFEGSWEGLDSSTTIMNWNSGNAADSLQFFHNRGHDQIIAAYYDEDVQSNLNDWVVSGAQAAGVQDQIDGVMYTTWIEDFSKLEEFAEAWWSSKPYVTPGGEGSDDDHDNDGNVTKPVVYFKLDETSGTTAVDSSGNGHDATVDDGLVWTSDGYNGGGLATDGAGCLRLPHTGDINVGLEGTDFTAAFWFKLTNNDSPAAWLAIARKGDLWNERGFGLFLTPTTRHISYSVSTTNHWNEGGTSSVGVQVNQWVHIALVKNDGVLSLYLDGAFDNSASLIGDSIGNNGDLYLGKAPTGSNNPVQAVFDNFRLYTRSLSTEEIVSIAAPSSSEAPAPSPPVFCFSASSTVVVQDKGVVSLYNLEIGDFVQTTAQGKFERVYSFGHRVLDPADQVEFLQVLPHELELSPNHMVFVESKGVVPASMLQVGDTFVSDGRAVELICKVRSKRGFVSPFTTSGTIMVNGVLSSNYIAFQDSKTLNVGTIETPFTFHWLAHSFQFPHRLWCHWLGAKDVLLDSGYSKWTQGPLHATQWLFRQKPAFVFLVGAPLVSVLGIFRVVEDALPNHNHNLGWFAVVLSSIALIALSRWKLKRHCGNVRPATSAHPGVLGKLFQEGLSCGCETCSDI